MTVEPNSDKTSKLGEYLLKDGDKTIFTGTFSQCHMEKSIIEYVNNKDNKIGLEKIVCPELFEELLNYKPTPEIMKKEQKYFSPAIEDIKVGYYCEINKFEYLFDRGFDIYNPVDNDAIWGKGDLDIDTVNFITSNRTWNGLKIQVPYLTKEQIEAEGWTLVGTRTLKKYELQQYDLFEKKYSDEEDAKKKGDWVADGFFYKYTMYAEKNIFGNGPNYNTIIIEEEKEGGFTGEHTKHPCFWGNCPDINEFRHICKKQLNLR